MKTAPTVHLHRPLLEKLRTSSNLSRAVHTGLLLPLAASCLILNTGCDTAEGSRALGTGIGAVGGAIGGALLNRRSPLAGALAGAALGAAAGNALGQTKLFKTRQLKFQEAVLKGDTSDAARYVEARNVNAPVKGYPPVYYAAVRGDISMIRLLARNGARLNYHSGGHSLAYIASSYGHTATGRALVNLGAGTGSDVSAGQELYVTNERERRKEAQACTALALVAVAAMISSSGSQSHDSNNYLGSGMTESQWAVEADKAGWSGNR